MQSEQVNNIEVPLDFLATLSTHSYTFFVKFLCIVTWWVLQRDTTFFFYTENLSPNGFLLYKYVQIRFFTSFIDNGSSSYILKECQLSYHFGSLQLISLFECPFLIFRLF